MEMSVSDIVNDVKVCIDEIGLNDAEFLGTQDNEEMDTIIKSKISEALRFVNGNADWSLLEPNKVITTGTIDDDLVAHVSLPENCSRVCYARLSSWPLFISDPIYWNDKEYATLSDPYATGTWERPKLALTMRPGKTLELYKARTVSDSFEIGIVTNEDVTDSLDISPKLKKALIYYISGLTLLTYRDQHADSMFNQALVLMGVNPSGSNANQ